MDTKILDMVTLSIPFDQIQNENHVINASFVKMLYVLRQVYIFHNLVKTHIKIANFTQKYTKKPS